jgi:cobalamin synthase
MKPNKNQASSIARLSALSAETQMCFGAAAGCLVLGLIGYAVNSLTASETTLSAFLVISAFYLMLGVISLFKSKPKYAIQTVSTGRQETYLENELAEDAA